MRLFVAIPLDAELRGTLISAMQPMRDAAPAVAWTMETLLHVTLKFLGDVDGERVGELTAALARVTAAHPAFDLDVGGFGAFPHRSRPRIIWAGVAPEPRLELLQHDVELACDALGFPLDGRPFRPQVTVGRVRVAAAGDEAADARALARAARGVHFRAASHVDALHVVASELAAPRARHSLVAALPLRPS